MIVLANLLPHTRCVPSPASGGGIGRGYATRLVHATPSPTLPRKRGRGHTESVALALAKSLAFIR
jgi:hypothetical protein